MTIYLGVNSLFRRCQKGAAAIEYALLVALLGGATMAAMLATGAEFRTSFNLLTTEGMNTVKPEVLSAEELQTQVLRAAGPSYSSGVKTYSDDTTVFVSVRNDTDEAVLWDFEVDGNVTDSRLVEANSQSYLRLDLNPTEESDKQFELVRYDNGGFDGGTSLRAKSASATAGYLRYLERIGQSDLYEIGNS